MSQRHRFGRSSEESDAEQLSIFNEVKSRPNHIKRQRGHEVIEETHISRVLADHECQRDSAG
jgi:hypothetical protein